MQNRAKFLNATKWFDPAWYLRKCPEAVQAPDLLSHYLERGIAAGIGPNPYIDRLKRSCGSATNPPMADDDPRSRLRAEMKLIAASGLFDASYYLENNPDVAAKGSDPLRHFCMYGWRQLRRPHREFDVWWYWSCHLDPAQDVVNPLVHYILVGHPAGLAGRPPTYRPGPGHVPSATGTRRICLLAGHDPDGDVDDYVVDLARELSRFADVYYLGDCVMRDGQLEKLDPYVAGRWAYHHGMYDFGSWSALATRHLGWNVIERYDELLLVNDSSYLVSPLSPVFARMQARACDWWGLQATKGMFPTRDRAANRFEKPIPMRQVRNNLVDGYLDDCIYDFHIGSYFVAFRAPVIKDPGFQRRLTAVCSQKTKPSVVRKYEMGLSQYLIGRQFAFDTFIDDLHPLHPVFTDRQFDLIEEGFPLFKRMLLVTNHYNVPGLADWKNRLRAIVPDAPVEAMDRNLQRVGDHEKLHRSFAIVEDAAGGVSLPVLLGKHEFQQADAETPKLDCWWAFAVDPTTGTLAGDDRAVFEAVRENPSIKKIVLTRWRKLQLDGIDVVTTPLRSPEGQYHLLRAGQIFAGSDPEESLGFPVSPLLHNLIDLGGRARAVAGNFSPDRHCANGTTWHLSRDAGLPRLDLVLCDEDHLPRDLRADHERLLSACAERRLVLLVRKSTINEDAARGQFTREGVAALHAWLRRSGMVLGVREPGAGAARIHYDLLRSPDTLDLSERRFPQVEILFRHASALVADAPDCFAGFSPTGRPSIWFGHDEGSRMSTEACASGVRETRRPDPTGGDLTRLIAALDAAFDLRAPQPMTVPGPAFGPVTGPGHARKVAAEILNRCDRASVTCT